MKPGLYDLVNAAQRPCIVSALEGRRLQVRRNMADDGWIVTIKRTKKPIEGVRTVGDMRDDLALNEQTKRTVSIVFQLSDEGAKGLWQALTFALKDKEDLDLRVIPRDFDDEETVKAPSEEVFVSPKYNDPRKTYAEEDGK